MKMGRVGRNSLIRKKSKGIVLNGVPRGVKKDYFQGKKCPLRLPNVRGGIVKIRAHIPIIMKMRKEDVSAWLV